MFEKLNYSCQKTFKNKKLQMIKLISNNFLKTKLIFLIIRNNKA